MHPIRCARGSVLVVVLSFVWSLLSLRPALVAAEVDGDAATVVVYGKAEASRRSSVAAVVEDTLRKAGWNLTDPFSDREIDTITRCFAVDKPGLCIAATTHAKGITRVVAVQVDVERGKGATATLRLSGQLAVAGKPEVILQLRYCTVDQLEAKTQELVKLLLDGSSVRAADTKIELRTKPQGVVVTLDGQLVGGAGAEISTAPGSHTLLFELEGYTRQTRTVEVAEGKTVVVEVELTPSAGIIVPLPPESNPVVARSQRWPLTLMAVGSVALIGGVVAVIIDEDPVRRADVKQPATLIDTARLGAGLIIGGAVVGGVGSYLWWRGRKHNRAAAKPPVSTALMIPTAHGAVVGVAGTF